MKIYSSNNIDKINTYTEVNSKTSSKELEASNSLSGKSNNKDEVLLSESAVKFSRFKERLSALPDVRDDIVAELKSRIQNGDYQVDGEKVADKMIEEILTG
ncbi:TPA: flagellar biosynthesis anti-sigma factor FlgM [Candidatus Poribacteria bacterium]|nr:flagellar biosynthesis anti-sigma factor FlgM [Candidatus Poribacteria bacterium]